MSREYPMFGLRMPPDLRDRLESKKKINNRSLNAEICSRLERSLDEETGRYRLEQGVSEYSTLPDYERQLLTHYRKLSPERQLALLTLLSQR